MLLLGKVNVFLHLNETCNLDVTLNSNLTPFTNNAEERTITSKNYQAINGLSLSTRYQFVMIV